ncbi:hypothetical protein [Streptomyces acidicola]|uniref:hypothetical protein n=1 Tax=Streptomyces acidicola TaxID=2596892 RepID=UPI00380E72C3
MPDPAFNGHFNVLRGYVAPLGPAGVKIVGARVGNYKAGLPSEMALLNLFDPRTGMPVAVLDATAPPSTYGPCAVEAMVRTLGGDAVVQGSDRPCAEPLPHAGFGLDGAAAYAFRVADPRRLLRGEDRAWAGSRGAPGASW